MTRFPSTFQLLQRVREIVCDKERSTLPALTLYLSRFAPVRGFDYKAVQLQADWDQINAEELYAAIEFESRITAHLMLESGDPGSGTKFYQELFAEPYQKAVEALLRGPYKQWMTDCYFASYGSEAWPYLHENFLRIVKMELLDSIAHTLGVLSEEEDTSNIARLVRCFEEGDTAITFNYDLLLEQYLSRERSSDWSYLTGYALRPISDKYSLQFQGTAPDHPSKFTVLKLHGSSNWHFKFNRSPHTGPFVMGRPLPEPVGAGNRVPDVRPAFFLFSDTFYKMIVPEGQPTGYFERFMIPPSTYKAEYSFVANFIHNPRGEPRLFDTSTMFLPQLLYRSALQALTTADRVVFLGFSMAPADTSIRMLFRAASDANTGLRDIEICDPSDSVETRIKSVIPNAANYKRFRYFGELLDAWHA